MKTGDQVVFKVPLKTVEEILKIEQEGQSEFSLKKLKHDPDNPEFLHVFVNKVKQTLVTDYALEVDPEEKSIVTFVPYQLVASRPTKQLVFARTAE